VAQGEFDYANGPRVEVKFAKPVQAKWFKLISKSELKGRPFTSIAELEMLIVPAPVQVPGSKQASGTANTVNRTALMNFTDQSSKYMRNWHRLKVVFAAPSDGRVDVVLRAEPGSDGAIVRFDDVRLVKIGVSLPPKGAKSVVLFEDFENVDEAWGPFMYGWEGPMNTHLSEANPPHTDDTIGGRYSLKSRREGSPGMLYRTVPATLNLKPHTTYRVSLDYLCDTKDCFALVAGYDAADGEKVIEKRPMSDGSWKVKHFSTTITTDGQDGWFIGVSKLDPKKPGTLVIDDFLVEEVETARAAR
jgi:endo-alpha-N-acetylgalactosaminidase